MLSSRAEDSTNGTWVFKDDAWPLPALTLCYAFGNHYRKHFPNITMEVTSFHALRAPHLAHDEHSNTIGVRGGGGVCAQTKYLTMTTCGADLLESNS